MNSATFTCDLATLIDWKRRELLLVAEFVLPPSVQSKKLEANLCPTYFYEGAKLTASNFCIWLLTYRLDPEVCGFVGSAS